MITNGLTQTYPKKLISQNQNWLNFPISHFSSHKLRRSFPGCLLYFLYLRKNRYKSDSNHFYYFLSRNVLFSLHIISRWISGRRSNRLSYTCSRENEFRRRYAVTKSTTRSNSGGKEVYDCRGTGRLGQCQKVNVCFYLKMR